MAGMVWENNSVKSAHFLELVVLVFLEIDQNELAFTKVPGGRRAGEALENLL
jgi:hypothetical protein